MREDPVARRNRGGSMIGVWILGGLAVLVVVLIGADFLRPSPAPAPTVEAPAAVTMKQRVANEEVEAVQRDRARAHAESAPAT
ncbi:hypothetical protein [Brevundimonas lenta]|uniref:Uncharacterized protein n=1 Tax=Brevundimonas lenta TaxID=424796 RepID=A0A7W6NNK1_9CAUL|nr:hypothetical protein [Brevundimonas lenta]MBB4081245.1 hypothetical protein [Brevundimonas lenta]